MRPEAYLYSAIAGLERASASLFRDMPKKYREELNHELIFEALAQRAGGFREDIASEVHNQVLTSVVAVSGGRPAHNFDLGRQAFDAILEPVLTAVIRTVDETFDHGHPILAQIVAEEEAHSNQIVDWDPNAWWQALQGAVKTLTCPFFARPLSAMVGSQTSDLGLRIRQIFSDARPSRGFDPSRVFGLCPLQRGATSALEMSNWEEQRVRADFMGPMLQVIDIERPGYAWCGERAPLEPAFVEAIVTKAVAETVRTPIFNLVRSGLQLHRLVEPVVMVRRWANAPRYRGLINVPLPTHDAASIVPKGFANRIARRQRVLEESAEAWWTPSVPLGDLLEIPTITGAVASVSSLARLPGTFNWHGFATPENSEGATYNVLVTDNHSDGFKLSIACDHRTIDGHIMGEFGLAVAARCKDLVSM